MNRPTTSASNIHRRKLCPGSERMEAGLPDEDSDQSREGVLLHGYDANPSLAREVLRPFQRDLLRISGELDQRVFERAIEQFHIQANEDFDSGREQELWVLDAQGKPLIPGHCDLWYYWRRVRLLAIIDKKFGYKIVTPAVANLQLRIYAIGGAQKWDADNVVVAVTQPRLPFDERLTLAAYSRTDIDRSREELDWILQAARQPNAPLVAGDDQCRYCKAKLICPAYREKYNALQVAHERTLDECNDDQLEQILVAIDFAHYIEDQAKDVARARVAAGRMPHYKLSKESETRNVVDVRRAMSLLVLRGDLSESDVKAALSMSIGPLEEKVRTRRGCTWKEAKEIVGETLESVIEKKPKKQSLIRK